MSVTLRLDGVEYIGPCNFDDGDGWHTEPSGFRWRRGRPSRLATLAASHSSRSTEAENSLVRNAERRAERAARQTEGRDAETLALSRQMETETSPLVRNALRRALKAAARKRMEAGE